MHLVNAPSEVEVLAPEMVVWGRLISFRLACGLDRCLLTAVHAVASPATVNARKEFAT
jgi:hypothetical protein